MEVIIIILRLMLTFILSLLFGMERQSSHKPIGFGSFTFVAIGSCGLAITAVTLGSGNPLPLLGAIITGIGFLGAGALIRTSDKIFGFTTAASLWIFAIIGLEIGVGDYLAGLILYSFVWIVVFIDRHFEKRGIGSYKRKITISTNKINDKNEIEKELLMYTNNFILINIELDKKNSKLVATYLIESDRNKINHLIKDLYTKDWFDSFKVD